MTSSLRASAAHIFVSDVNHPALDDADQHHLSRVLRLRDKEIVSVCDGFGQWRTCLYTKEELVPDSDIFSAPEPACQLTVAIVPVKGDRTESAVEKLVEAGIHHIIILSATDHGVVRWDARRASHHIERLERITRSSAMQSRRLWLPTLTGPVAFADVVARPGAVVAEPGGRAVHNDDRIMIIGPEGGFSASEVAMASATVSLGDNILRADTAAIVGATLMVAHGAR